jgi:hypothetical protein
MADWEANWPTVNDLLHHGDWRCRMVACQVLAARGDMELAPLLVARAADRDWHVRQAAFEGLWQIQQPPRPPPMRDTPLDDREKVLLEWIGAFDGATGQGIAERLCQVFANDDYFEFGQPMTAKCLACHAGRSPAPVQANQRCTGCHGEIGAAWASSAHAQGLSSLHLVTVDPTTRSPRNVDFGDVRGIGCIECHRLAADGTGAAVESAQTTPAGKCPFTFDGRSPSPDSCRRCHGSTFSQCQDWQSRPHPRRLDWPPGQIEPQAPGDTRTCVDCHMPVSPLADVPGERPVKDHRWAARRNERLLREGLAVDFPPARPDQPGQVQLRLTNLAGHEYPTGTLRRALGLTIELEGRAPQTIALLSADPRLRLGGAQPPLAAGQSRTFTVALPGQADEGRYRLRYYWNYRLAGAPQVDFLVGNLPLSMPSSFMPSP